MVFVDGIRIPFADYDDIDSSHIKLKPTIVTDIKKDMVITSYCITNISNTDNQYTYTVGTGGVLQYTVGYISNSDTIMTASSNNVSHCGKVVGIITENKLQGEQVKIQYKGEISNSSWNLTSGDVYFVGKHIVTGKQIGRAHV